VVRDAQEWGITNENEFITQWLGTKETWLAGLGNYIGQQMQAAIAPSQTEPEKLP